METITKLIIIGQELIDSAKAVEDSLIIRLPQPEPGSDRAAIWADCALAGEFSVYELEEELEKLVTTYPSNHELAWFNWLLWVLFDKRVEGAKIDTNSKQNE